jgi:hypothetical protein
MARLLEQRRDRGDEQRVAVAPTCSTSSTKSMKKNSERNATATKNTDQKTSR